MKATPDQVKSGLARPVWTPWAALRANFPTVARKTRHRAERSRFFSSERSFHTVSLIIARGLTRFVADLNRNIAV